MNTPNIELDSHIGIRLTLQATHDNIVGPFGNCLCKPLFLALLIYFSDVAPEPWDVFCVVHIR